MASEFNKDGMLSERLWNMAEWMADNFLKDLKDRLGNPPEPEQDDLRFRLADLLLEFGMEARLALMNERDFEPPFADWEEDDDDRLPSESELVARTAHHAEIITRFVKQCGGHKDDPELRAFSLTMQSHLLRMAEEVQAAIIRRPGLPKKISKN